MSKKNKSVKKAKPTAKKSNKPANKKVAKPIKKVKPVAKKGNKPATKKVAKPAPKKSAKAKPVTKKTIKPAPVKSGKTAVKKQVAKPAKAKVETKKKSSPKEEKEIKKPLAKSTVSVPAPSKKKGSKTDSKKSKPIGDEIETEDLDLGEDIESLELDGEVPEAEDDFMEADEAEKVKPKGRKKRRRGDDDDDDDVSGTGSYIRRQTIKIDINKPLIKKGSGNQPKPFVNTSDKRTRYNDSELAEFKELILQKLKEAETDYDLLKSTLSNKDNHGTDDTSPTFKLLEDGSSVMSKEETAQLAARQEKYIISLRNALIRIQNKTYGICRQTGRLIPKQRLRSVPHATLSIDAKLSQDRKSTRLNSSHIPLSRMPSSA